MAGDRVNILAGNTFVVSDTRGDIDASPTDPSGLFSFDTRFLSTWVMTIDGRRLTAQSLDDLQYFETRFFLVLDSGRVGVDPKVSVIRQRAVSEGFREELTILNHGEEPVDLTVRFRAACDFADLFEVKGSLAKKGTYHAQAEDGRLVLEYTREQFHRQTVVSATAPAQVDEHGLTFTVHIEPKQEWTTELRVVPTIIGLAGRKLRLMPEESRARAGRTRAEDLHDWLARAPRLECDWDPLKHTYERSLVDLAALRFVAPTSAGQSLPAAGLPWFMSIFGRDSIFTSLQALPFQPELAATALRELGSRQGTRRDDFREEERGRIVHELRFGETAAFEEQPHSPYYGSADATPLFVVLLDEYERWTGDADLVRQFEYEARAALEWIDEHGDLMGNGYLSYRRRNEQTGLENQCWKDSWDAISYRDGRLPGFPRATCELQGYAYDAKTRAARLARLFWDDGAFAEKLEAEAADLKRRFNDEFWLDERQCYALGLDADGSRIDALASNMGHLLWSGIVDAEKADAVVRHLLGPALFSGWGVRTLGTGEGRYNPVGYHVGTVWPFDNSFIAWGLRRYGYEAEAARVAAGILDAAPYFGWRLPEAFAGHDRTRTRYPVEFPTACSPQAWSAGAPLLLLRTMLGLETSGENLVVNPALPQHIGHIELLDIPGRWGRRDAYGRGTVMVES
ncbi:glycogen debranching N-terminal domain-containing protein [Micromonospora sp. WMMD812]|uniref:amylo-alpha-1,6-glucosidase n=1 Tax=Micromonospora sp. WMMD812 TaxID=3015152 RepID=UPI00248B7D48|nr:glycogen debranching N-terminal domain-containing protein [Micromonospora sp. WMMD812]WBB70932.1 amylo-alpha-1,6-glucosidase [Micromonospora sp. WMMD812]